MFRLLIYIIILILCDKIHSECVVQSNSLKHIKCIGDTLALINSVLDKDMYEILTIEDPADKTISQDGIQYPSLVELHITSIKKLNRNAFENLENLEKLIISDSPELTAINRYALKNLEAEYLKINGTNLETIELGAFDYCNLVELDLSYNRLGSFEEGLFDSLSTLEILNLRSNKIQELPPNLFVNLDHLERLDLSSNQLTNLPDGLFEIDETSLEEINLSNNNIQQIKENLFNEMSSLKSLDLSHNKIKSISLKSFAVLKNLQNLDLSGNTFETKLSKEDFDFLPSLITLNLESSAASNNVVNLDSSVISEQQITTPEQQIPLAEFQTSTVLPIKETVTEQLSSIYPTSPILVTLVVQTDKEIPSTIKEETLDKIITSTKPTVIGNGNDNSRSKAPEMPENIPAPIHSSEDRGSLKDLLNLTTSLLEIINTASGNGSSTTSSPELNFLQPVIPNLETLVDQFNKNPSILIKETVKTQSHKIHPTMFEHEIIQKGSDISIVSSQETGKNLPTIHIQQTSRQQQKILQNTNNTPITLSQIVSFLQLLN